MRPGVLAPPAAGGGGVNFTELLDRLGHTDDERVVITYSPTGGPLTIDIVRAADAPQHVDGLPDGVNVWFNVNPTSVPLQRDSNTRGTAADVTRLAALHLDLDIKPGGCPSFEVAEAIVNDLSALLGARPIAVVRSGHGLHAYWAIEDGHAAEHGTGELSAVLRRFGRLAAVVAANHDAKVDSVFDTARMLRVTDTVNYKEPHAPVPVTGHADNGGPLTIDEVRERLDEAGVHDVAEDQAAAGEPVSTPDGWQYAPTACGYAVTMIRRGWPSDSPAARHPWLLGQATRLTAAHRLGCLTAELHREGIAVLTREFERLCARPGDARPVQRFEIQDALAYGEQKVMAMTGDRARTELGGHLHDAELIGTARTDGTDKSEDREGASSPTGTDGTDKSEDGEAVLDDIADYLARFVSFPSVHAMIAYALWIAHTHLMEAWESTPRFAFLSPEPGSGKTRALAVAEPLVPRPVHAVNCTPAYLFRKVSDPDGAPTIFYDEIDTVFGPKAKDNEDIRGMLNAGHRKGAMAGRCVVRGKVVETEEIPPYCAVALAGLNDLPDTIMTRSIVSRMRRRKPDERVEPWRGRINGPEGAVLGERLARWADAVRQQAVERWPEMPDGIEDRDADVWEPLLAVADLAGARWPAAARAAAVAMVKASKARTPSLGIQLLRDVRRVFEAFGKDQMSTIQLLAELIRLDESPWGVIRKGEPLDSRGLASRLRDYGIESKNQRDGYGAQFKGYAVGQFADAWARYLPDDNEDGEDIAA
jgi:hypothetical protein